MSDPVSSVGPIITSPIVMGGAAPAPDPVVPVPDPAAPLAPDVAADPAAPPVDDVNKPSGDTPPAADPNAQKATPEWAQKRINELTAKRYEAERSAATNAAKAEAAEAKAAELLAQIAKTPSAAGAPPAADSSTTKTTDEEIEKRAIAKAEVMAQAKVFNDACNKVAETGKSEYKESWDESLKNLNLVGALGQGVSPEFLETAVELKNPHKVLHYLGQNLEEAEKLVKMNPKRMAMEMARIEATVNAPAPPAAAPVLAPVSNAPPPVIPVGGAAKAPNLDVSDPTISMEDFAALRQKQMDERRKRYQRA